MVKDRSWSCFRCGAQTGRPRLQCPRGHVRRENGLDVRCADLRELLLASQTFSASALFHVIEHLEVDVAETRSTGGTRCHELDFLSCPNPYATPILHQQRSFAATWHRGPRTTSATTRSNSEPDHHTRAMVRSDLGGSARGNRRRTARQRARSRWHGCQSWAIGDQVLVGLRGDASPGCRRAALAARGRAFGGCKELHGFIVAHGPGHAHDVVDSFAGIRHPKHAGLTYLVLCALIVSRGSAPDSHGPRWHSPRPTAKLSRIDQLGADVHNVEKIAHQGAAPGLSPGASGPEISRTNCSSNGNFVLTDHAGLRSSRQSVFLRPRWADGR